MWDKDSKWCRISYGKQKQIDILTKNLIYISETYFTQLHQKEKILLYVNQKKLKAS